MTAQSLVPAAVISHWQRFVDATFKPISTGLINFTLEVQTPREKAVLQRLHSIFAPEVNLDIAAVTEHLSRKGLTTPKLLPTDDGALWVEDNNKGIWRAQSFIPGNAYPAITNPNIAYQAGRLVGKFHIALADLNYSYRSLRQNVHDTKAHLLKLIQAVDKHNTHRLRSQVAPLAEEVLREAEIIQDFSDLPLRHTHGDLKISNLMFDSDGTGLALIDLDTLARMAWPLEMGDALRSWCNPKREDQRPAQVDLALLQAAMMGYRETARDLISKKEWAMLIPGLARICLELSARFFADALNENYFGWDASRYSARGEHNLARGIAMLELYWDVVNKQKLLIKLKTN
jgi:Ser/Thr protein kinase RdoA (MazF antagonist)